MEAGTHFSFPMTGGKVVGFHGKSGWYLDAVGVYLKPLQNTNNIVTTTMSRPQQNLVTNNGNEKLGFSMIQESVSQYGYDIVVAVRQKDDHGTNNNLAFQKRLARQNSFPKDHFDGVEFPNKVVSGPKIQLLEDVPQKLEAPLTFGPWGGNGGTTFDDGIHKGIRQIKLSRNVGIVSMKVLYDDGGEPKWGTKHGGTGGLKSNNIVFDYPLEILTHISGTMGSLMHMGPTCIKSLTFYTNKGKYGPFGEERGPSFTSKLKEGRVVGFHGRGGLFLDAIGVHVVEGKVQSLVRPPNSTALVPKDAKPVAPPASRVDNGNSPWSNKLVVAKQGPTEEVYCGVVKEPAPCGPGPWGGDGGKLWDDGAYSGIRQIYVTRADAICSIQIEYDQNGQPVWSAKHGGNGGSATHKIKLEYPHEVLVCISGYYGSIAKDERPNVVRSLTFHTSRGKYGPYGEEIGTHFTSTTTQGKVVGFHGRSSLYLDAIGVHMQHWLGNQKPAKQSLFRKGR